MTNINLPTYEQVEEIRQQFPISGGTDWFESTFSTSNPMENPAHKTNMLLEITGEGIITFLKSGANSSGFTVEVDGLFYEIGNSINTMFPVLIPFYSNIKVSSNVAHNNGVLVGYNLF